MLTELRRMIRAELDALGARRPPALKRTEDPDALLATDLPLAGDAAQTDAFLRRMKELGVTCRACRGWILLDAAAVLPPDDPAIPAAGECACCLAILRRHMCKDASPALIRRILKASEAGKMPFERLCTQLHAELAAMLRRHETLPADAAGCLAAAWKNLYMND